MASIEYIRDRAQKAQEALAKKQATLKLMEGRIEKDIWYIEHWSFSLDLFIIWRTIYNALHGEENAY